MNREKQALAVGESGFPAKETPREGEDSRRHNDLDFSPASSQQAITKSVCHSLWACPWSWAESFIVAAALGGIGAAIQTITQSHCPTLRYPANLIVLLVYATTLIVIHLVTTRSGITAWLSSIPAATAAIVLFGILTLAMGLIPQYPQAPAWDILRNIAHSWPYCLAVLFLLTTLGLVILRRAAARGLKDTGFLLNHLGLWVVLAGGSFGAGDLQRLSMETVRGQTVWVAETQNGEVIEPGIGVELKSFDIEYFKPAMVLYDLEKDRPVRTAKPAYIERAGANYTLLNKLKVQVETYLPQAFFAGGTFQAFDGPQAVPAAQVLVTQDQTEHVGWISPPNQTHPGHLLMLDQNLALTLQPPQPKKYLSEVKVYTRAGQIHEAKIEVNKPLKIASWRIYQVGYDATLGKWSNKSILEFNRDPWLPCVYTGLVMMSLGAVYLLFSGSPNKNKTT